MKHVKYKIFTIFNYEEEEKWLNEMSKIGLQLTHVEIGKYIFEDSEPGKYIYRLELLENSPADYQSIKYLSFLEETGVEHVASLLRWVYLRKKAEDGPFDIYSDMDSRIKHYKRIISLANVLIAVQFVLAFPNIIAVIAGSTLNRIFILNLIVVALLAWGKSKVKKKVDSLEKEKTYRE